MNFFKIDHFNVYSFAFRTYTLEVYEEGANVARLLHKVGTRSITKPVVTLNPVQVQIPRPQRNGHQDGRGTRGSVVIESDAETTIITIRR